MWRLLASIPSDRAGAVVTLGLGLCWGTSGQASNSWLLLTPENQHTHLSTLGSPASVLIFVYPPPIQNVLGYYLNTPLYFLLMEWKNKKRKELIEIGIKGDIQGGQDSGHFQNDCSLVFLESSLYVLRLGVQRGNESEIFLFLFFLFLVNIFCFWIRWLQ